MKFSFLNIAKYVIALLVAFALLFLAFKNVDIEEFWAKASEVDYTYIYISLALGLVSYWLRAYRWNLLLHSLGYENLTASRTTVSVLVGYLANMALPRMGEVTRCAVLQRTDKVKFSEGLGSVIVERIVDTLTLMLIIAITFLLEHDKLFAFFRDHILMGRSFTTMQIVLVVVVLIVLAGVGLFVLKMINDSPSKSGKVMTFLKEALGGLKSIKNLNNIPGFVLSTLGIWVSYYFMSYIIVFSIAETSHLGILAGLSLLVTGGIGMAMPVQGGIGAFHLFVSTMLISYGIEQQTGIFLATLLHTSQVVAVLVFGAIALLISFLIKPASARSRK